MNDFIFKHTGPITVNVYGLKASNDGAQTTYSTEVQSPQGEPISSWVVRLRLSAALGGLVSEFIRREGWGLEETPENASEFMDEVQSLVYYIQDHFDAMSDEEEEAE